MTDPKEQVVSEVLCRNHISGFGEVCAGVCGDSIVPGQPHPCEHALTVWRSDAQEILRALLARVDPKALEELDLASRAIERVRALLAAEGSVPECSYCHGRGYVAGDPEGAPIEDCQQCGGTGRASSPSPAVRDVLDHLHAMAPGIRDLDALDAVEKDDESMRSAVRDVTLREALERLNKALLSDAPSGPQKTIAGDDTIYHLDGQKMYHAINAVREAIAALSHPSLPEGGEDEKS